MKKYIILILFVVTLLNCTSNRNRDTKENINEIKQESIVEKINFPKDTLSYIRLQDLKWLLSIQFTHHDILKYCLSSEIRILRNEIFARKGYVFKDNFLNTFFRQKDWYISKYSSIDSIHLSVEEQSLVDSLILYERLNEKLTIDSIYNRINNKLITSKLNDEYVMQYILKRFVDDFALMTANKVILYDTLHNNMYHFVFNTWTGAEGGDDDDNDIETLFFCTQNSNHVPIDLKVESVIFDSFQKTQINKYSFLQKGGSGTNKICYEIDSLGRILFLK